VAAVRCRADERRMICISGQKAQMITATAISPCSHAEPRQCMLPPKKRFIAEFRQRCAGRKIKSKSKSVVLLHHRADRSSWLWEF
jgi:hypothetical protein